MNTRLPSGRSAIDSLLLALCGALACLAFLLYSLNAGIFESRFIAIATVAIATAIILVRCRRNLTNLLISMPLMFLLGLTLLNLGQALTEVLGLWDMPIDPVLRQVYGSVEPLQSKANLCASLGILSFIAGLIVATNCRSHIARAEADHEMYLSRMRLFVLFSWCVFMSIIVIEGYLLSLFHVAYGKQNYNQLTLSAIQMALSSCLLFAAHTLGDRKTSLLLLLICASTYGLLMLLGFRGYSFMFIYGAFTAWLIGSRFSLKIRHLIVPYIVGSVMWAAVGDFRNADPGQRQYLNAFSNAGAEWAKSLMYPINLIVGQEVSLRYGVLYVQDYGIAPGMAYWRTLPYALPNLFGEARKATDVGSISTVVSATYVRSYGLGFTPIAEAYCNGGILGVCAVMFLAGVVLQRLQRWFELRQDSRSRVVLGLTFATTLWWVRNDAIDLIRFFLWGYILYLVLRATAKLFLPARGRGAKSHSLAGLVTPLPSPLPGFPFRSSSGPIAFVRVYPCAGVCPESSE
jgi:hypothetical protein